MRAIPLFHRTANFDISSFIKEALSNKLNTRFQELNEPIGLAHKYNYAYGDTSVAAKYCGFKSVPLPIAGEWQHGAIVPERNRDPDFVVGSDGLSYRRPHKRYFVARQDQVLFLESCGFTDAHAIGLPMVYVNSPVVERIPNSLLVMPVHSLPETREQAVADDYIQYIMDIRHSYSFVAVSLHKSCLEKGEWKDKFERNGVQVICGADPDDISTYERLSRIFGSFEHITSNGFGSHIPYAGYFGARVSIAGPVPPFSREHYQDVPYFRNNPKMLGFVEELQLSLPSNYPFLFANPALGVECQEWADGILGANQRCTPKLMKRLFGWNQPKLFARQVRSHLPRWFSF